MFLEVIRLLIMKARIEGHEMAVAQAVKKATLLQGKMPKFLTEFEKTLS